MNYGAELLLVAAARGDVLHTVVPDHRGADDAEAWKNSYVVGQSEREKWQNHRRPQLLGVEAFMPLPRLRTSRAPCGP